MVFKTSLTIQLPIFFFSVFFVGLIGKHTFYFSYVTSLNFWETNILFIFFFFTNFIIVFFRIFLLLLSLFVFKLSNFSQFFFFKYLITSLIIGTVVIHPLGFYLCTVIFLIKFFYKGRFFQLVLTSMLNNTLFCCFSLTLFLGSLWATQSSSWGYFWVNDLVEWSLLFFIIYTLVAVHIIKYNLCNISLFFLPLFLVSFLIFLRFGFFSTRHNFIVMQVTFFLIFLIYWCCLFVCFKNLKVKLLVKCGINLFVKITTYTFFFLTIFKLYWLKYFFFSFFLIFLMQRLSVYTNFFYFHIFCLSVIFVWIIFFKFFFLNYNVALIENYTQIFLYNGFNSGNFFQLTNFVIIKTVDVVNFFFNNFTKYTFMVISDLQLFINFNNICLSFILTLIIIFSFVKLVEFRFLY